MAFPTTNCKNEYHWVVVPINSPSVNTSWKKIPDAEWQRKGYFWLLAAGKWSRPRFSSPQQEVLQRAAFWKPFLPSRRQEKLPLLILGSTEGFRLQWGSLMPGRMGENGYLMQNRHFTRRRGAHRCKQRHEQALPRPHSFSRSVYFLFWTTRFSQFAGIWGILLLSSIL